MAIAILNSSPSLKISVPILKPLSLSNTDLRYTFSSNRHSNRNLRSIVASNRCGEHYNYSSSGSLNLPLQPRSSAARLLSRVLQDNPQSFYDTVSEELNRLVDDRDGAFARSELSLGSDEACLHRRIAELKEHECRVVVEDVMYMLISYEFSEIKVPLVPRLHECLYNGRLEILPNKEWQLESIHSPEVLKMIREYLRIVIGCKTGSSVVVDWSTTQIQALHLSRVYAASILYGYFLKSASLRHHLECSLSGTFHSVPSGNWAYIPESGLYVLKDLALDQMRTSSSTALSRVSSSSGNNLSYYVMGFDPETVQVCAKLKSEEATNLIENHCLALFGEKASSQKTNEVIITSISSLKRLVLEAIAFGCFLWDAEDCVDRVYKLTNKS
ncbi:hypothetical protein Ancab_019930 [Ancistrocladus abbreviatus]